MEQQPLSQPQTPPPAPVPAAPPSPPTPPESMISRLRSPYAIVFAILVILIFGSIIFATTRRTPPVPLVPTPTPTPMPTPTPIRQPSAIATQSAFLSLEAAVSALSNNLQSLTLQDPSLSPPVLDLPLGFK